MRDCLSIQYYKDQVYDPSGSFFKRAEPDRVEREAMVLQNARDINPYLQNPQEIDRLLRQAEKYQKMYKQNMEERKSIKANKTRNMYTQQLKQTLATSKWLQLDNDKDGRDFKRDYLTLSDQQALLGNYKMQNAPNKYKREYLSQTSKMQRVGGYEVEPYEL